MGGSAHITINVTTPNAVGSITNTATVDPNNTILERSETNNVSSVATSVRVDLVASAGSINDRATFGVTNASGAPANNVLLKITEPSTTVADIVNWSANWMGSCYLVDGGPSSTEFEEDCVIPTIPAHTTETITLQTFYWPHTYTMVLDPNNTIAESNEANNVSSASPVGF
jgi:subtilase family serine protease